MKDPGGAAKGSQYDLVTAAAAKANPSWVREPVIAAIQLTTRHIVSYIASLCKRDGRHAPWSNMKIYPARILC
jgi:hypothetical protein